MDVFEEVAVRIKTVAGCAGKKASEMVEVQKLKMAAAQIESEIKSKYEILGKLTYNSEKEGKCAKEASRAIAEDIEQMQAQLAVIRDKIYRLKNIVCCPNCRAINSSDAVFCNKCGTRIVPAPCADSAEAQEEWTDEQAVSEQLPAADEQ
ncbi:MAG: zinc ribbon domain-containing protein [Clostridiales bacterium]|nr:zinc ribbon domain-containing protein [Clostridiales bacterium]